MLRRLCCRLFTLSVDNLHTFLVGQFPCTFVHSLGQTIVIALICDIGTIATIQDLQFRIFREGLKVSLCLFDMLKWRGRPEMNMTLAQFREKINDAASPLSAPAFAPETARVDKLLSDMRRDAREIVVVVDEYGGTSGVVTQDDLIEELVGRFANGEVDVDALHRRNDGSFLCDGRAHLRVLEKTLGDNIFGDEDAADTIGGLIMERTESIPKAGTEVVLEDGTKIMVRRMAGRRVKQVLIVPPKNKGDGA